jgi:hypothetical protein
MGGMQQSMMMRPNSSGATLRVYTSGTGATETAPAGATNVVIGVWGGGSSGTRGTTIMCNDSAGRGGNTGAYSQTSVAISAGQTLIYTVGAGGASSNTINRNGGANSTCSSGTKTITTMTAGGGPTTNTAATASGGTALNTSGGQGELGGNSGLPGTPITGIQSEVAGQGGTGSPGGFGSGSAGSTGKVAFYYT